MGPSIATGGQREVRTGVTGARPGARNAACSSGTLLQLHAIHSFPLNGSKTSHPRPHCQWMAARVTHHQIHSSIHRSIEFCLEVTASQTLLCLALGTGGPRTTGKRATLDAAMNGWVTTRLQHCSANSNHDYNNNNQHRLHLPMRINTCLTF